MPNINYYSRCLSTDEIIDFRHNLVKFAYLNGVKAAAREYSTTVKTVRKWLSRFDAKDINSLADRARKPNSCPQRIKPYWRFKIIDSYHQMVDEGQTACASYIRREYNIPYSLPTVLKVIREAEITYNPSRIAQIM